MKNNNNPIRKIWFFIIKNNKKSHERTLSFERFEVK
jgi:hypothetical protein